MRRDGFTYITPNEPSAIGGGELLTQPIRWVSGDLYLNADCLHTHHETAESRSGAASAVRVGVLVDGKEVAGFSAVDCTPFVGNATRGVVQWAGGAGMGALVGKTVEVSVMIR